MTGTVYKSTGSWYTVKSEEGDFMECRMKGKFRLKGIKSTNPIAVGDIVDYELDTNSDTTTGMIHKNPLFHLKLKLKPSVFECFSTLPCRQAVPWFLSGNDRNQD